MLDKIVDMLRKDYPKGTRIELLKMDDTQAPPIGTKDKRGVVQKEAVPAIKTSPNDIGVVVEGFDTPIWVRRFTPKECFRIMNFDDIDFIRASRVISDSLLYHIAGDSIVVGVLEHIFKKIL